MKLLVDWSMSAGHISEAGPSLPDNQQEESDMNIKIANRKKRYQCTDL